MTRHPATEQILRWFAYEHLAPGPVQDTSLEAKDAFVRAAIAAEWEANA